ncbi:MAG: hypothetical protein LC101_03605 [Flavobacteriales bacterium]|nr:hypothetical protein [Flavobacteriales bacterium]
MADNIPTCYMCDLEKTSLEHVPPKCIFPESKDTNGIDFRKNLITVPSCVAHNTRKSGDDEFLMISLAGVLGNNSIGYAHHLRKGMRAIKNSAFKLLTQAYKIKETRKVNLGNNRFIELIWGTPDSDRLIQSFERIAIALYLHYRKTKFKGEVRILLGHLSYTDKNSQTFVQFIKDRAAIDLADSPRLGDNPRVFYCQWFGPDPAGVHLVKLCFYENIDIYAAFLPEGIPKPSHLAMTLIDIGVKTTLSLGDKEYEFN